MPRPYGVTDGVPWTAMEILERQVRIPHGASQFVVAREHEQWAVLRADTLEPCPPDEARDWRSVHDQLAPALREALARQEVWTAVAIGLIGSQVVGEASSPTIFERRAHENRARHGWTDRPETQVEPSRLIARPRRRRPRQVRYPQPSSGLPIPSGPPPALNESRGDAPVREEARCDDSPPTHS